MYKWKTDKETYLKFKTQLYELHPEIKVEIESCDDNLEKLGFVKFAPCVVNIYLSREQRRHLLNELELMEMDAVDNEDVECNERYERYGWLWDVIFYIEEYGAQVRKRAAQINTSILQSHKTIYRLRKLDCREFENITIRTYIITLEKDLNFTLEEQIRRLYVHFQNVLCNNEYLNTDNHCFSVCGENYKIMYCIEAYKKNANKFGYVENNEIKTEFLHRMGCEIAFKWLKKQSQVVIGYTDLSSPLNSAEQFMNKIATLKNK